MNLQSAMSDLLKLLERYTKRIREDLAGNLIDDDGLVIYPVASKRLIVIESNEQIYVRVAFHVADYILSKQLWLGYLQVCL